jgi:hypothetical protein
MSTVRFASNEEKAIGGIIGLVILQFKIVWWIIKGIIWICTFGYVQYRKRNPQVVEIDFLKSARFEHTFILGGSGHGKTQLLQAMFLRADLPEVRRGHESVIIIDSQGDMLRNILHLLDLAPSQMESLADRLILIDPNDIENPPCLNLFDFGLDRVHAYDAIERERLVNGAIALYEYIFGALLGAELTNRQGVVFRYLARLLMVVPNATIHTLMDFVENPELVKPYLPKLDPAAQRFFTTQFASSGFDTTRQQIAMRLWGVLSNPVLARMFSHTHNNLNLFEAMNKGSLILINTAKDLLKQDGCELFGKFMLALITQATQERAAIPEFKRLPTFVYIDEAHDYFDEKMQDLFNTARKYKVGLVIATQNLAQFSRELLATVMASTSVKFVGGLSASDAEVMAKEMQCDLENLRSVEKTATQSVFAFSIRNRQEAAPFQVVLGEMERRPKMSETDYEKLRELNRKRVCAPAQQIPHEQHIPVSQVREPVSRNEFDLEAPPSAI